MLTGIKRSGERTGRRMTRMRRQKSQMKVMMRMATKLVKKFTETAKEGMNLNMILMPGRPRGGEGPTT